MNLRFLCFGIFGFILGILLLAVLVLVLVQSEVARTFLADRISRALSTAPHRQVSLERVEGFLPFEIRVKQLNVSDSKGCWLLAEGIVLRWSPSALPAATIRIPELSASRIIVHRLPDDSGPPTPGKQSPPSQLLGGVPAFALESLSVPVLTLDEGVTGHAADFAIEGNLSRRKSTAGLNGTLSIRRIDGGPETRVDILAGITGDLTGLSIQASLTESPNGFFAHIAGLAGAGSLNLRVDGSGPLPDWRGSLHLGADRLGSLQGGLRIRGDETTVFEVDAGIHPDPHLVSSTLPLLMGSETSLELTISKGSSELIVLDRGRLVAETLAIDATGQLNLGTMETSVRSGLHVEDLRSLTPLLGREVSGRAAFLLSLESADGLKKLKGTLHGEIADLGGLPDYLAPAMGPRARMDGRFFTEDSGLLQLPSLQVMGDGFFMEAKGWFNMRTTDAGARMEVSVPDVGVLSKTIGKSMAGSVQMTAELEMLGAEWKYRADFSGRELTVDRGRFPILKGRLNGMGITGSWGGDFSLEANEPKEKLALKGAYELRKDVARLSDLNFTAPGSSLQGSLSYNFSDSFILGEIDGRFTDLAALGRFAGMSLRGRGELRGKFSRLKDRQHIEISIQGKSIGTPWGDAVEAALTADLVDPARQPSGRADLSLRQFKTGGLDIHSLSIKSSANGKDFGFSASAQGKAKMPFTMEMEGSLAWAVEETRLRMNSLKGRVGGRRVQLDRPLLISRSTEETILTTLVLRFGEARLEGDGTLAGERVTVNARLVELPLGMLSEMGIGDMQGKANGTLSIEGNPSSPRGEFRLNLSDVRTGVPEFKNVPPASISLQVAFARNIADARFEVGGVFLKPAKARVSLPVQFSLQPVAFEIPRERGLEGNVELEADLQSLMSLYPQEEHKLMGTIAADLNVRGSLASPDFGGSISMSGGRYENWTNGTVLDAVSLRMSGRGKRLEIEEFRATDGEKGRMEGTGWIQLEGDGRLPLDLSITVADATLLRREDLSGSVTGNVALSGSLMDMVVAGQLRSGPSEFNLVKRPPPAVSKLHVIEINKPGGHQDGPSRRSSGTLGRMVFGLALDVPRRFHVRGGGLESEWSGSLKVSGDSAAPSLSGNFDCIRGHFDFLDKRFKIVRGIIELDGAHPPSPKLDLVAEAKGKEILARIRITGSASSPKIALESDPQMPQDEILSNLLFGRSLSSINPMQAVRLAQAVRSLSGNGGGLGIMDQARKLLGVDQIGFRESQEKESKGAFGIGKYITDDIYVDVQKDFGGSAGKATVDVELTPNISVQGQAGTDASTGIGLNWKHDY